MSKRAGDTIKPTPAKTLANNSFADLLRVKARCFFAVKTCNDLHYSGGFATARQAC
jgi:hypothetical protein